jgi:hypothetical protein
MYATVRRYEGVSDPTEAARHINEGFLPIIREVPGFVAYYWVDAGDGVMISTSVFEDQSGAEETTNRAADYVQQNMTSILPNPPQITAGEVVAFEAPSSGPVSGVTDTVGGVTDTVGGATQPVSGVTDTVSGTTGNLLGGGDKKS